MAKSMTGFGRAQVDRDKVTVIAEIKTVNSRYLDVNIRIPNILNEYEPEMRKLTADKIGRGKCDIRVSYYDRRESDDSLEADIARVNAYRASIDSIAEAVGKDLAFEDFIPQMTGLFISRQDTDEDDLLKSVLFEALDEALDKLGAMRAVEGENLKTDLAERVRGLASYRETIAERAPSVPRAYRERLLARLEELMDDDQISEYYDGQRVAAEIAVFTDKADITEEIVRLESHLNQFLEILDQKGSIGKKLDFLTQEILREVSTIGSKANDLEITKAVVEMKNRIEQIREQIQNLE